MAQVGVTLTESLLELLVFVLENPVRLFEFQGLGVQTGFEGGFDALARSALAPALPAFSGYSTFVRVPSPSRSGGVAPSSGTLGPKGLFWDSI